MRYRKYILNNLLLPVFACLLAGLAGCSNEVVLQDDDSGKQTAGGGTYLVIQTRANTTEYSINTDDSDRETYVSCLRVIGFKDGKQVCNELHNIDDIEVDANKEFATFKQEIEEQGDVTLYFIANEKWDNSNGYEISTGGGSTYSYLSEKLADATLTEEQLNEIIMHYTWEDYAKGQHPFLMIAKKTVHVLQGVEQNIGLVELERVFAKLTVMFQMEKADATLEGTVTELKLTNGNEVPYLFNLIGGKTSPTTSYIESFDWLEKEFITNTDLSQANTFSVYVPERILSDMENNADNAWNLSVKVQTVSGRTVSGILSLNNGMGSTDYNIYRNTDYQVTCVIPDKDPLRFMLNVLDWTKAASQTVEWSKNIAFNLTSASAIVTDADEKKYYPISYTPVTGEGQQQGMLQFTFELESPLGASWTASLSDGNDFEFVDIAQTSGIGGNGSKTFAIRAKDQSNVGTELTLEITVHSADGGWDKIMINANDETSSGSKELILIKQVEN